MEARRTDIEGLRAVAVAFVLAYHGFGTPFTGGFVGVDVFFVISGFLITNLLLREQSRAGSVSIVDFYARRVRRILPASTLVVVATMFSTYYLLGFVAGNEVATDGQWTAIFAANIHFGLVQTDYFGSRLPPSPLQHMWSLGVEEQFYAIWPALFLLLGFTTGAERRRSVLAAMLLVVCGVSFWWSILQTESNPLWAYFSPLTRAWELAAGALVAVLAPFLAQLQRKLLRTSLTLAGVIGIGISALVFDSTTPYPGAIVAMPVIGTALVIAAGCIPGSTWMSDALSVRPMQWLGARSYSLYLWHWPILSISAELLGNLAVWHSVAMLLLTVVFAAVTYRLVENPVRGARFLKARPVLSLALGSALILQTVVTAEWLIAAHWGSWSPFAFSLGSGCGPGM